MSLVRLILAALLIGYGAIVQSDPLPGTQPLAMDGDLSAQMVGGIDRYLTAQTARIKEARAAAWPAGEAPDSVRLERRARLAKIIGAVDPRALAADIEFLETAGKPSRIAETGTFVAHAIRWKVFEGVHGEGLWLRPKKPALAWVIALPDADQTPEMLAGLQPGIAPQAQFARRLAEAGCEVFVPTLIDRGDRWSGSEELNRFTNQPHREWIYRQAYEVGRHLIGYEVQKVQALVDWIERQSSALPIGLAGYAEGGLIALHAAALDTRIRATLVSGYFAPRERVWAEPIYRNIFGFLRDFGDAELGRMIAPRRLILEYSEVPKIDGPPAARQGRGGAAPGQLRTPERYQVEEEVEHLRTLLGESEKSSVTFVHGNEGATVLPGSTDALAALAQGLGLSDLSIPTATEPLSTQREAPPNRQRDQILELVQHTQAVMRRAERARDREFWGKTGPNNAAAWTTNRAAFQKTLWDDVLGRFEMPTGPANARTRKIYDQPKWTGYETVLEVAPDVFAWGVLCVPKGMGPNERRPVVVCQHGLEGVPADTIEGPDRKSGYPYYKAFTARLAERGFVTFAPHNPYRGQDLFRVLQRKANPLGRSLFSVILGQHEQLLNWLSALPFVDPERIGFYGLSYGGKTAMRVPSLLDRYCLSICSADFNEWVKKNATVYSPYSYMFTGEYEMPEFDLGHTFNYAEMAALVAPRPFMVERGHDDGVAPDEWVAYEFAKVRRFYTRLKIADRTEIEFFDGPHTINGVDTYKFLHRHLRWPEPAQP